MIKDFKPRLYQETILNTCANKNTLVVLPTGLGKTAISLMLAVNRITNYPNSKVLILAPNRPLVAQHMGSFKKYIETEEEKFVLFTGAVKPEKRAELWKRAQFIFSTPQGLSNDIINRKINLEEVSLLVLDEVQHAIGDYDYVWIAKQYHTTAKYPRILGLSASPGANKDKIEEILKNTFIEDIEIRTHDDEDVKIYIKEKEVTKEFVELPENIKEVKKFLEESYKNKLKQLKETGHLNSGSNVTKTQLLEMQRNLQGMIARGEKDFGIWHAISMNAQAMKVAHAIELIETQGIKSLHSYLSDLFSNAEKSKVKATKNLVKDADFKMAYMKTAEMLEKSVEHPKLIRLKEIIKKEIDEDENKKIIVFTNYRDSAKTLTEELCKIDKVQAKIFVGQTKKNGTGMSQKDQSNVLEDFKNSLFNVIVMTSVGEEGIDIPAVDLVIFYEPVPSAIRSIQRKGRTGRLEKGRVIYLIAKNTRDEVNYWISLNKERKMKDLLANMKNRLFSNLKTEKTLKDFSEFKVLIDVREKGSQLAKHIFDLGLEVDMKTLPCADIIINNEIGIERKTKQDFVDSMIDKRLLNQLSALKSNFSKPILLLEGEEDIYSLRNIHPNAIRGMFAAIATAFQIPIIWTRNAKESADYVKAIAERERNRERDFGVRFERKPMSTKEQQQFIIESLPGIGPSLAKALLNEYKTVKNVINADDLDRVDKIGSKIKEEINRILNEEFED